MSLPTNCWPAAPQSQDRHLKVRNGNICGSPRAVNRPIDIVQKQRRRCDVIAERIKESLDVKPLIKKTSKEDLL
ncbi:hypothetical protein EYF80_057004 [Liparis tanakae]|uniref:Uncharacterized protein n=1 Tax=Liparis tanakae TaxID=230148 RepID=A0A4Z2EWV0_9TELE|nr:hypothetical protein EYF80_057004 [Liparis tanakae]